VRQIKILATILIIQKVTISFFQSEGFEKIGKIELSLGLYWI